MNEEKEKQKIREIIALYEKAFVNADADLMERLFWVGDPRFTEVESHIPKPFSKERFLWIMDWIRHNQAPGGRMHFYETRIHFLSPTVAYSISLRDTEEKGELHTSRVTLIYLKQKGSWKIIHGHFSFLPKSS
ncbi:MAG: nuclear transport factor 2 family protein [Candidatus Korarchaeota archaeon]|nr:nuclear transport factor 2 family protein [Candidatus Korarchaeota archaeon]NIU83026.1 hypothetical protein [Candidatus Thorarchaeota archaeon]NIW13948.1 hypothetical protein [Candidatus Thorarchaeota archaeon]NIW51565.1 hypothetical protein [Candidatus Korarchaeota archaeon]